MNLYYHTYLSNLEQFLRNNYITSNYINKYTNLSLPLLKEYSQHQISSTVILESSMYELPVIDTDTVLDYPVIIQLEISNIEALHIKGTDNDTYYCTSKPIYLNPTTTKIYVYHTEAYLLLTEADIFTKLLFFGLHKENVKKIAPLAKELPIRKTSVLQDKRFMKILQKESQHYCSIFELIECSRGMLYMFVASANSDKDIINTKNFKDLVNLTHALLKGGYTKQYMDTPLNAMISFLLISSPTEVNRDDYSRRCAWEELVGVSNMLPTLNSLLSPISINRYANRKNLTMSLPSIKSKLLRTFIYVLYTTSTDITIRPQLKCLQDSKLFVDIFTGAYLGISSLHLNHSSVSNYMNIVDKYYKGYTL